MFTSESGHQFGYEDGFQGEGIYWYTGEGQKGDMLMVRGNLAICDHAKNGRELHLFESEKKGEVRYIGPAIYLNQHEAIRPDVDGNLRKVIVFELDVSNNESEGLPVRFEPLRSEPDERKMWKEPLEKLRARALEAPLNAGTVEERKRRVYQRSRRVKVYVLRRANGVCEGCGEAAPFTTIEGNPYLEPHHIRRVSDQGPDHPRWVAALCPNCHRRVHYGQGGEQFNEEIAERIAQLES